MASLRKRSTQAFIWDISGTLFNQGAGFLITIFLARLLEPAEFGLVGMALVFVTISQVFVDIGFTSALIQRKDNSNLAYSSVFYVNVVAGALLTLIFFFAAPLASNFYGNTTVEGLVRWLSLIFIFNSFNLVQATILKKNLNFKILTIRSVVASVAGGVIGIICALSGMGVYSLVAQQLTSALLGTILLWTATAWRPELRFSMKEVSQLTSFSGFVFFDRFLSAISHRLDVLLIGKFFSPASLGFYTRAVSLKDLVTKYSSASLTKIFFPVLSDLKDDEKEYSRIYFKVISVITFLSYGLTGILYILGADVIVGLFGHKWEPSIPIFQVLILSVCNFPLNSMMVNAFLSKGKSKENFLIGIFRKLIRLVPIVIGYFYGMHALTVSIVIVSYILTIVNIGFLAVHTGLSVTLHIRKIFEGVLPLVAFITIFHLRSMPDLIDRILLASSFGFFYFGYNYLIKSEGLMFMLGNGLRVFRGKYV